ncbi:hypothetical protein [Bacteriovorax sp. DB6_IX]|uniref:hypothetical protein n=1 Tax=Bacteriovorax sp. DB6_IX TaxID=1353530 RepID=UPI00038A496C|nr:hypothetical protein [Bacteriovorax sp. DB6_IX]EQC51121.1 hypothetical protein M901_0865 [Bacteriovorax sp. DB6_IX]
MKHEVNKIQKRNSVSVANESDVRNHPDFYIDDQALEELQLFCQELNPYEELSLEEKLRLQEYGIMDLANPFEITNKLLLILENNIQYREKLGESQ